jgi:hypothetical protein
MINQMSLKTLILLLGTFLIGHSQERNLSGKIIDEHLEPLNGAKIQSKDSAFSSITDEMGYYSLNLPSQVKKVRISCIGMESEIVKIGKNCRFDIILFDDMIVEFETKKEHLKAYKRRRKQLRKLYEKAKIAGIIKGQEPCK